MIIHLKRIYEPYATADGVRILVDRLWPRGIKKEKAHVDRWFKDIAPTQELRKWYKHDPNKFADFSKKYHTELSKTVALDELMGYIDHHDVITFLYAAKEERLSNAVVLRLIILERFK